MLLTSGGANPEGGKTSRPLPSDESAVEHAEDRNKEEDYFRHPSCDDFGSEDV